METEKMDDIFKRGLSGKESEVKADSWSKMEMMIDSLPPRKKGFPFWKVAAILIIIIFSALFLRNDQSFFQNSAVSKYTPEVEIYQLEPLTIETIPLELKAPQITEILKTEPRKASKIVVQPVLVDVEIPSSAKLSKNAESLAVHLEHESEFLDETEEVKPTMPIKITYKRSKSKSRSLIAKEAENKEDQTKIKELLNQAKGLEPAAIWADVRDAKQKAINSMITSRNSSRSK